MKIYFTTEKKDEIERIMQQFEKQLSKQEILKGAAQGINSALSRSIPRINKQVKNEYNISQKYLSRMATVFPKANSYNLYGGIHINDKRLPIIAFKPKQKGSSIAVTIHKGKTEIIRNSFIATMSSGHTGVFSRGRYDKRDFVPERKKTASGKTRITQVHTASVFAMGVSKSVANDVQTFMGAEAVARVEGILRSKVEKIAKNF
ncbi:MAG: phage tail protein [Prevotellaceae bacterium]|jgi:hypothetical protein|nr:phage tail protein [Prevotellaceae bacterium]